MSVECVKKPMNYVIDLRKIYDIEEKIFRPLVDIRYEMNPVCV